MSCGGRGDGGRFVCGMRRFDKYKIACEDKPSNKVLHDENTRRFQELMDLRSRQDKGIFEPLHLEPLRLDQLHISDQTQNQSQSQKQFQNQNKSQNQTQFQTESNTESERVIDFDTYLK
jgi:hypothetical protein